ncbi:MAG: glycosyl hydrolase-related protein [Kiritimatiellaeota bacterium]|nr:glycosyl hydrolase-related protein [Kiritimatiellota bacterium]
MSHFYDHVAFARLERCIGSLPAEMVLDTVPLSATVAVTAEPVPWAKRKALKYRTIGEGEAWGKTWDCGWFNLKGAVPSAWKGAYVTLVLDVGGEALVFDAAGCPTVGLSNACAIDWGYKKETAHLIPKAKGGEKIDLWIETGANGLFGVVSRSIPAPDNPKHRPMEYSAVFGKARLCRFDIALWHFWLDLSLICELARELPLKSRRRNQLLRIACAAMDVFGGRASSLAAASSRAVAARAVAKEAFDLPTDPAAMDVYGVGHAHIDTAWLWPIRETIRKCARTFASQIGLIERYPGYVFGASQAQLYAYTKEYYPALYAKIKKAIKAGQWEVQGGMWVEADCNIIGGESMIRQCLHGKNYFRDEFGIEVKNLWLPDVFGYSGNLPQILKRCGIDTFLTTKLAWNIYNKLPHNTFLWKGIDGSEVLAYFPPEDTYNANITPSELLRHETNNREAGLIQESIGLFGTGDGGGGPKEDHIERALRCQNFNGLPRFHFSRAQPILEKLATYAKDLDTWHGELYFELHRGTLTTQADMKRWNRRAEEALRAAEMICAAAAKDAWRASVPASRPYLYPHAELDALWKTVLLHQFHDIIPGSSITRVYAEAIPLLKEVVATCKELQAKAMKRLGTKDPKSTTLFNPSSTPFRGIVNGHAVEVPPQGTLVVRKGSTGLLTCAQRIESTGQKTCATLENDLIRYEFDAALRLTSVYDKTCNRELIPHGQFANRLELFHDIPHAHDAWDIEEYYREMRVATASCRCHEIQRLEAVATLKATLHIGESAIEQTIRLEDGTKRLDFITDVDWRERHKLLRVAFPTTIVAAHARFDIQYGTLERATHDNTSWEHAQFEVTGHRFADLSEDTYGIALLNDSKYGYRVKGSELSLSLLRAPTDPDPIADIGQHRFTYSLLPHNGALADSDVLTHAAILNQGIEIFDGIAAPDLRLPVRVTGDGVEMAVLKRAEKEDALIVRIAETRGRTTTATLTAETSLRAERSNPELKDDCTITECDALEWNLLGKPRKHTLSVTLTPFSIRTFKIA